MKYAEWILGVLLIIALVISCSAIPAHAGIKVYADAKSSDAYISTIDSIDKNHVIIVRNWK